MSWADFYAQYRDYIAYRLRRRGFDRQDIEDETMSIITRLIERNYLAIYDPAKGASFFTMLTETVKLTSWGVGERLWLRARREVLFDAHALPREDETPPVVPDFAGTGRNLSDSSVEDYLFDSARILVAVLHSRLQPALLPLLTAMEESLGASETALARRLGRSRKEVRVDLEALRTAAQEVRAELAKV